LLKTMLINTAFNCYNSSCWVPVTFRYFSHLSTCTQKMSALAVYISTFSERGIEQVKG